MSGSTKTPYMTAVAIVLIHTGTFIFTKAALNQGINSFVFTFYRQAAASILLLPVALVFQRENMSSLSLWLLLKLFSCALIGITISLNMVNMSLSLTSATVGSATSNSVPICTFCFALLFRMEVLKPRSSSGIAKIVGTGLCIAGVFIIAFYVGPALSPDNHHHAFTHTSTPSNSPSREAWIKGTFLMVLSTMSWSIWLIMLTAVLKEYPNKMLVTVIECVFSAVQCFLVALVAEHDFSKWKLRLNISLLAVIYCGFVVTGLSHYLQVWCIKMKGPVFLAMWTPLMFVFTVFCSWFFLGEIIHLGSIIGGIVLVGGLYSVLWAKTMEPTTVSPDHVQHEKLRDSLPRPRVENETSSTASP